VCGGILIVNAAGKVDPSRWVSMEGAPELSCTRGRVPLGLGVFPCGVLARYTQSKPRLVLHLPVTNEEWLGGPPLEKRDVGVLLDPWLIAISLRGGFRSSGR